MARSSAALKVVLDELPTPQTLDVMIARLEVIRTERSKLSAAFNAKDEPLKKEFDELKGEVIKALDTAKTLTGSTKTTSVSISETPVPVIKDKAKLIPFIVKNKLWHLFLAQPLSTPAWRECVGLKGMDLPGTETFVKRDLNIKARS